MRPVAVIRLALCLFIGLLILGGTGLALGFLAAFREGANPIANSITIRLPVDKVRIRAPYIPVEGELTLGSGTPSQIQGNWSHFRGENRNAVSTETVSLRKNWSKDDPPPILWGLPLGEGFAGFAVRNGRVYILDYDMENERDALRCLSFDDGQEIWRYSYSVRIKKNHGMSRTIPAVNDQYCISIGPKCHVLCVDAVTGEEKWLIDLRHEYDTVEPDWYAGQCPMIVTLPGTEKPSVLIAPSGPEALMVALDCETGKEVWRTPNPFGWNMTHTSIMPMTLEGEQTFVYFGEYGLVGVRAADGTILWSWSESFWPNAPATCSSPIVLPDNRIFFCGGYRRGAVIIQVVPKADKYETVTLQQLDHTVFDSEQQTPVFYGEHIFGIRQNDKQFLCLDLEGRVVWTSGRQERFGSGPCIIADSMILVLDDDGKLSGLDATPAGFRKLFEVEIMEDFACWAPLAIVNGRLLLRDQMSMKCIDLR